MCTFLSTRYRSQKRFAVRITVDPDGVFESCDARLRDVGGQFTVLERVRVSPMSFRGKIGLIPIRSAKRRKVIVTG